MNDDEELTDYEYYQENPSEVIELLTGKEPFDYQQDFLDNPARHKAFVSGRQVGKSLTASWIGLAYAITHQDSMVLITAPSLRQSSMLFKTLRSEMSQSGVDDETWGVTRDTQTIIEFDNGSEIHCLPTGRDGSKIRGYSADMIIVDEASFIENSIFEDVIEPMTFATGGQIILTSTPWGTSGFFYKKATKWATDNDATTFSTWDPDDEAGISSDQSPLVDEDDLEKFKDGKTKRQIKQEVLGKFVKDGSQFFNSESIRKSMQDSVEKKGQHVYLGVDIAAAGADQTVFTIIDDLGNVFHEIETYDEYGVLDAAERIQQLDAMYNFQEIVVDRSGLGQGTAEKLADYGDINNRVTPLYLTVQKKQTAYQSLKAELEGGHLTLPHNGTLRSQLKKIGYTKTKTGNLSLHGKDGAHDDYVDSLALAVWAMPSTAGGNVRGARGATEPVTKQVNANDSGGRTGSQSSRRLSGSNAGRTSSSRTDRPNRGKTSRNRRRRR